MGTLQNAFKKFAVLLRMQWGPVKMPAKNSLLDRCAATTAFNKFAVLLTLPSISSRTPKKVLKRGNDIPILFEMPFERDSYTI